MRIFTLLLIVFSSFAANAQNKISGNVSANGSGLIGAEVMLYKMNSELSFGTLTDDDGNFEIQKVEEGEYRLVISYLGFKKYRTRQNIQGDIILDPIQLEEDVIEIDGVEITGSMIQAIQKGDTTVFNAGAFKTLPDADAKDLIAKIPGIEISGGTIKANGEDVQKVTVDGREFFGNDPNIALNALPAEIIDKIEIIDEQSEQSQFSGFNDGNTTKTINIVTKQDKRNGEFGKVYAGYGENDRYQAGGNINIFNGDQRTSFIGLSNNINQQNFSSEDLLGVTGSSGNNRRGRGGRGGSGNFLVGQQNGIATTHSIGVNFSDKWGEKVDFSGSYFFNASDNNSIQKIDQEYFSEEAAGDIYKEDNTTISENMNHRFQGRLEIKFNEKNSLSIRPRLSFQDNNQIETSETQFLRMNANPDLASNTYTSDQNGMTLNNSILYRRSFEKRGRTFSISFGNSSRPNDGSSTLNTSLIPDGSPVSLLDQLSVSKTRSTGYESEISYTEPLSETTRLSLNYEFEKDNGDDNVLTYTGLNPSESLIINNLSNDQENQELTNTLGASLQWRKEKTTLMARAQLENSDISANQTLPAEFTTSKSYLKFLPFIMARIEISDSKNLRIYYRPRTDNPSSSQLSETLNNNNPLQLSKGNINLEQGYQHSLFTRYSSTNKTKGTVFFLFAGADYSNNYIGQQTYLSGRDEPLYEELGIDTRAQLSLPVNVSGYYNLRSYVTIGLPVTSIKSKLNFNLSGNYSNTPSIIDNISNKSKNATVGLGVSLTSNISTNVDFTISTKTNLGEVSNTLQPQLNTSYINQQSDLKLEVILPYGITWRNQATHQIYSGYGDEFDSNYLLASMSIGKKFLKNNRAEISLSVFDLFNQNQEINRNVTGNYIESTTSNVLQRYFMLNLRYDLRHFGKDSNASSGEFEGRGDFDGPRRGRGGRDD